MSSESSPKDRRGKTTLHGVKATPKAMRPVQPDYVYDSYEDDRAARREERRARRNRTAPDLSTYGMFAFFVLLGIGVVFFLVQGGSTMEVNRTGETNDEVRAKNEETRKLNEQRAREAALRQPSAPAAESRDVNIPARQPAAAAPVERSAPRAVAPQPAADTAREAPPSGGGISAGMVPPELQKKISTEPRTTIPEETKK